MTRNIRSGFILKKEKKEKKQEKSNDKTDLCSFTDQLTNKNWIKQVYQIYFYSQSYKSKLAEEKADQCLKNIVNELKILDLDVHIMYWKL